MNSEEALSRLVLALESIAISEKRIADSVCKENPVQDSFREVIENLFSSDSAGNASPPSPPVVGPVDSPADFTGSDSVPSVEEPRIIDSKSWYIDTAKPERPIMVRLTDGTVREPTPKEAATLN